MYCLLTYVDFAISFCCSGSFFISFPFTTVKVAFANMFGFCGVLLGVV